MSSGLLPGEAPPPRGLAFLIPAAVAALVYAGVVFTLFALGEPLAGGGTFADTYLARLAGGQLADVGWVVQRWERQLVWTLTFGLAAACYLGIAGLSVSIGFGRQARRAGLSRAGLAAAAAALCVIGVYWVVVLSPGRAGSVVSALHSYVVVVLHRASVPDALWLGDLRWWLNAASFVPLVLLTVAISVVVRAAAVAEGEAVRDARRLLYAGSLLLVVRVAMLSAWLRWPACLLAGDAAKQAEMLAESMVMFHGAGYSVLLLAAALSVRAALRRQGLSTGQEPTSVVGELVTRWFSGTSLATVAPLIAALLGL